jgi:3-oxoacyl-[acyl-carrier-protein] synthase II
MRRRVVITGIGVLSCIATGRKEYWDSLVRGRTGFAPVTLFDTSAFAARYAGEISGFAPEEFLGKKGLREMDRSTRLVCSAAKLALDDSGLVINDATTHRVGVSVGATFGSLHSIAQFDLSGLRDGPRYVNPSHFPNTVINSPASQISIRFAIKGFNTTVSTGFCAGIDALSYAADFLRLGRADAVLAGGVEELCEETFRGFLGLGCLSGGEASELLCCPFDMRRSGAVISEGAAVLIMEESDHALQRGAPVFAEVLGYGSSFDPDADRRFSHAGRGLEKAVRMALDDAALPPARIDYMSSCANSSRGLDSLETRALKTVFGKHAFRIPVSSIKSMIGESFSASGALSVAAGAGVLQSGLIPPTINYRDEDPDCDLDYVPDRARQREVKTVLVTAADPYGYNAAMVLGKYRR